MNLNSIVNYLVDASLYQQRCARCELFAFLFTETETNAAVFSRCDHDFTLCVKKMMSKCPSKIDLWPSGTAAT